MKPHHSRISTAWVFVTGILRKVFSFFLLVPIYILAIGDAKNKSSISSIFIL